MRNRTAATQADDLPDLIRVCRACLRLSQRQLGLRAGLSPHFKARTALPLFDYGELAAGGFE